MSILDEPDVDESTATKSGWQFSLLGLLVLTTIVSVCLGFSVWFPRIAIAAVAVGLVQAGILYLADWLMRSRGGRTVKQVTAAMWAVLGTALLLVAFATASAPSQNRGSLSTALAVLIGSVGLSCFLVARRRWR